MEDRGSKIAPSRVRKSSILDPRSSIPSGHHREHSQNRLTEAVIADDFDSRRGFFLRQTFSQQTPCRVLIHPNLAGGAFALACIKAPRPAFAPQCPGPARFARDDEADAQSFIGLRLPVRVRQPSEESVEYGEEPFAVAQRRRADGVANLLLMMPFLGVFARDVEPVL